MRALGLSEERRPFWLPPRAASDAVTTALFRALAVLRFFVAGYALLKIWDRSDSYARPELAWVCAGVIAAWTLAMTWAYDDPRRRRFPLYAVDLAVTIGLILVTPLINSDAQNAANASHIPTFWVMAVVLAWAVGRGPLEGLLASALVSIADVAVKDTIASTTWGNIFLLALAAGMVGYTAQTLRASAELRAAAERQAAAAEERARLARVVHDGVLQVLALMQRRGAESEGDLADLGRLAGEQEVALRALMQGNARERAAYAEAELVEAIEAHQREGVTITGPGRPVSLPENVVAEIAAAVGACLDNVAKHVGPTAHAWVLVEDLGDRVVVTVRDDGPGIPEGRLPQAAEAGRLGVSQSIVGRVEALGGTAVLFTRPDAGTEWELSVPRT